VPAGVVNQRYGAAHRALLLINDRRDILFLSLSSHGSDDPELFVSNGALNLEQVTGENLRQALREWVSSGESL